MDRLKLQLAIGVLLAVAVWLCWPVGKPPAGVDPPRAIEPSPASDPDEVPAAADQRFRSATRAAAGEPQGFAEALVAGRVTDEAGEALAGARVGFEPDGGESETDSDGYYQLAVPAGLGWIRARAESCQSVRRHVEAKTAERVVRDFVLPRLESTLQGTVTDALSGAPVEGISVVVSTAGNRVLGLLGVERIPREGRGGDWGFAESMTDTTDAGGHFRIPAPAGSYSVRTRSLAHLEDIARGRLEPAETRELSLRVFAVETMILRVESEAGETISGAYVDRSDGLAVRTGDDGVARFPLTPATIEERYLGVYSPGFLPRRVRLPASQTSAVVTMERGPQVSGIVVDSDGRPVSGARLQPRGVGWRKRPPDPPLVTGSDGSFRFHIGLPPLDELLIRHPGFVPLRFVTDEVDNEGPFRIVLERARAALAGVVIDARGLPLRHFEVQLRHPTRSGRIMQSETFHDENGRFRMDVRPGVYRVVAYNRSPQSYGWRTEPRLVAIPDQTIEEVILGG